MLFSSPSAMPSIKVSSGFCFGNASNSSSRRASNSSTSSFRTPTRRQSRVRDHLGSPCKPRDRDRDAASQRSSRRQRRPKMPGHGTHMVGTGQRVEPFLKVGSSSSGACFGRPSSASADWLRRPRYPQPSSDTCREFDEIPSNSSKRFVLRFHWWSQLVVEGRTRQPAREHHNISSI